MAKSLWMHVFFINWLIETRRSFGDLYFFFLLLFCFLQRFFLSLHPGKVNKGGIYTLDDAFSWCFCFSSFSLVFFAFLAEFLKFPLVIKYVTHAEE